MRRLLSRRDLLLAGLVSGLSCTAGCGTLLYPERRGQPAGRLDWGVVLLDGLGLLLFFVPGVIAFAVDFATGAIYLPQGQGQAVLGANGRGDLRTISVPTDRLSHAEIARTVSLHTGQNVTLEEGKFHSAEIASIDQFWPAMEKLEQEHRT
jgi:hypothetical protein